jgi:hypothetical protein
LNPPLVPIVPIHKPCGPKQGDSHSRPTSFQQQNPAPQQFRNVPKSYVVPIRPYNGDDVSAMEEEIPRQ